MIKEKYLTREKPYFLRRAVAYIIDMFIVTLFATVIATIFIDNTNYKKQSDQLMELTKKYTSGEITKEEYSEQFDSLNYYLTKEGVGTSIVNCSVAIVYFVIMSFFCHGITLGKYIMKLQIKSANGNELNVGNYLIRALFVNLILSNLVSILFVYTMNKSTFIAVYPKVSSVLSIFLLVTLLFIMYREDGRGLHDLMANTIIVSTKKVKYIEEDISSNETKKIQEEVKDAKVIKEKKTVKKDTTKKTTKKTSKKKEQ